MSYYIGLMSGTSMDAVDAALVEIDTAELKFISSVSLPYPHELQQELRAAIRPDTRLSLHEIGSLDAWVAEFFASACKAVLKQAGISPEKIDAIGSHGQTLRHSPDSSPPYTIQIGNGAIIAAHTEIDTVSDFRTLDVALGGQGAPLVPAFHEWLFRTNEEDRLVLNIGGIANISYLPKDSKQEITGFDTGPGNCLMDEWCQQHQNQPYDEGGAWAATGTCRYDLLEMLLADPFFKQPAPKSTGREKFNLDWLAKVLKQKAFHNVSNADVQMTLLMLTAQTVSDHITEYAPHAEKTFVCGGGAMNSKLMEQLKIALPRSQVTSTLALGLEPRQIEACAFAWFAYCRKRKQAIKLTTGLRRTSSIIGALHVAP